MNENNNTENSMLFKLILTIAIILLIAFLIPKNVNVSWEDSLIETVEENIIEYKENGFANNNSYETFREFKLHVEKYFAEKFKKENGIKIFGNNDYVITSSELEKYINNEISKEVETKNYEIGINEENNFELEGVKIKIKDFVEYIPPMFLMDEKNIYYKTPKMYTVYNEKNNIKDITFKTYNQNLQKIVTEIVESVSTNEFYEEEFLRTYQPNEITRNFYFSVPDFDLKEKDKEIKYEIYSDFENNKINIAMNDIIVFEFNLDIPNAKYTIVQKFDNLELDRIKLISEKEFTRKLEEKEVNKMVEELNKK